MVIAAGRYGQLTDPGFFARIVSVGVGLLLSLLGWALLAIGFETGRT